jgi:hypothetical protein
VAYTTGGGTVEISNDPDRGPRAVDDYPTFELRYCLDDWNAPSTVTVFSTHCDDYLETTWMTAAHEDAVDLDAVR